VPGPKMFTLNSWIYFTVLCAFAVDVAWREWGVGRWFDCGGRAHAA
jgi:hypothetical protein